MVKSIVVSVILVVFGVAVGFWMGNRPRSSLDVGLTHSVAEEPRGTARALATPRSEPETAFLGVVLPVQAVDISPEIDGTIEVMHVNVGDRVRREDPIATLDVSLVERDFVRAQYSLRALQAEAVGAETALAAAHDRSTRRSENRDLFAGEEIAQAEFQVQAASALDAVRARISEGEALVGRLGQLARAGTVRAPFDGVIGLRYLDAGATLARGAPIVRLFGDSLVRIRFAVPDDGSTRVEIDDTVAIEVEGRPESFTGMVDAVAPDVDVASGMILAEARIASSDTFRERVPAGSVVHVTPAGGFR